MEALEAILTRRSIRKYTDEPVSQQEEEILLKAAMNAQNTIGKRDWVFVVVRDPESLNAIADCVRPNGEPLRHTPMAIVVCGDLDLALDNWKEYWVQDCSAAATNILLAAHSIGLGAVWYGVYPQEHKVRGVSGRLALPDHIVPLCIIGLGRPAETKADLSEARYELHKVHHELWEGK